MTQTVLLAEFYCHYDTHLLEALEGRKCTISVSALLQLT